jgi:hypothetical protein
LSKSNKNRTYRFKKIGLKQTALLHLLTTRIVFKIDNFTMLDISSRLVFPLINFVPVLLIVPPSVKQLFMVLADARLSKKHQSKVKKLLFE